MKKILVYGSQEFGQVIKQLVPACGHEFIGFIDDYNTSEEVLGDLTQVAKSFHPDSYEIVLAIGYKHLHARLAIFQKLRAMGYATPSLIHPKAYVWNIDAISPGAIIMASAVVDVQANIGSLVVIWPGAVVNHNAIICTNTFLSPNATVCGYVSIGENCFVGAGAVIVDHAQVPPEAFIKAGVRYS